MPDIHQFNHAAMATHFQVRIVHDEKGYAAQAAQATFDLVNSLESCLSRFRTNSDIARAAHLAPGEKMRLSEPAFACLQIAKRMEEATHTAFCPTPGALKTQASLSGWDLVPGELSITCLSGRLEFDLGAIGKGFALDRMAELLRDWDISSFLLVAGGSSILAGDAPPGAPGWSCGLGEDNASERFFLTDISLSGSGVAVKGAHILDPRTAQPASRQLRAWVIADSAAESDALSTACMVLSEPELEEILAPNHSWLAFLDTENGVRPIGSRALPIRS
ncbi:FAD:protein FMN transferase [Occallatibacter riparius]|uniref:FAD:protein FMN transferase n=1 Tax=Occallatibacter riparius TaxID=1002689 RepID=A0A9J7BGJ9_9BACT|nr:FAD:protein FMN transferase [Occallatibacter riparius]UWZ81912.1 FAD:protein FMN transferase [Occallatibacter riparius]